MEATKNKEANNVKGSLNVLAPGKPSRILMAIRGIIAAALASWWNLSFSSSADEALTGAMVGVYASWIVKHTLGLTLRTAYIGSLGAVISGFTAWISFHACGKAEGCLAGSILMVSLMGYLLPMNAAIQNIWVAFHAGTVTAELFSSSEVSPNVAWNPTLSALVGAFFAIVAAAVPFPHWSITEVRARLQMVAQMYEAMQRMTANAFNRETFQDREANPSHKQLCNHDTTQENLAIFSQTERSNLQRTNKTINLEGQKPMHPMGLEVLSVGSCFQEKSPLIHASVDYVDSMLRTHIRRIENELEIGMAWEGPMVAVTLNGVYRNWISREKLRSVTMIIENATKFFHKWLPQRSSKRQQIQSKNQTVDNANTISMYPSLVGDGLLPEEGDRLKCMASKAYEIGYRNQKGERSTVESLTTWLTQLRKLHQLVLVMGEVQKKTDFVPSLKARTSSSLGDIISKTIEISCALLHGCLLITLEEVQYKCFTNFLDNVFGAGSFKPVTVSPEVLQLLETKPEHENLSLEISSDGRPKIPFRDSNGRIIPAVHKPGNTDQRRRLYELRHQLFECLRELTKRYGFARVRILYNQGNAHQVPNRKMNFLKRNYILHSPPLGTIEDEQGEDEEDIENHATEEADGDCDSCGSSTSGSQTSFSRQSDLGNDAESCDNQTCHTGTAIAPINCFIFCLIRMVWTSIETVDDLGGLKHAEHESEEGYGENRASPASESVNLNMSEEELKQVNSIRQSRRLCISGTLSSSAFSSNHSNDQTSEIRRGDVVNADTTSPTAQHTDRSAILRHNSQHVKIILNAVKKCLLDTFEKLTHKTELRKAIHITIAVMTATTLTLVPFLRQQLPHSYWAPVSVAFIAGTSAGSNLREGIVTLMGTVLGSIFGYMVMAVSNSNPWAIACAFTIFNGVCMYVTADAFSIDKKTFVVAAYTAPIIMFGANGDDSVVAQGAALERVVHTVVGILLLLVVTHGILPIKAESMVHNHSLKVMHALDTFVASSLHSYIVIVHGATEQNIAYGTTLPREINSANDAGENQGDGVSAYKAHSATATTAQNLTAVKHMLDISRYISHFRQKVSMTFLEASNVDYDPATGVETELRQLISLIPEAEAESGSWNQSYEEIGNLYGKFTESVYQCIRAMTMINQSRLSLIRNHSHQLHQLSKKKYEELLQQGPKNLTDSNESDILCGLHLLLPLLPSIHRLQLSISETIQNILAVFHLISNLHETGNSSWSKYQKGENMRKAADHGHLAQKLRETNNACNNVDGNDDDGEAAGPSSAPVQPFGIDISADPGISSEQKAEFDYAKGVLWSLEKSSDSVGNSLTEFQKLFSQFTEARIKEARAARLHHEIVEDEDDQEEAPGTPNDTPKAGRDVSMTTEQLSVNSTSSSRPRVTKPRVPSASFAQSRDSAAFDADCSELSIDRQKEERDRQGYDLGPGRGPSAFSNSLVLNINSVSFGLQQLAGALSGLSNIAAKLYYSKLLSSTSLSENPSQVSVELLRRMPWKLEFVDSQSRIADNHNATGTSP